MAKTKSDQFNPKDLLTIPNIITYFRILCIPAFVALSIIAGKQNSMTFVYWSLGVFAFAAISDVFDGFLARKFNWGTGVGMLLDPLADKLMHISVALCLAFAIHIDGVSFLHWGFIIAIIFKELIMISFAPIVAKKGVEVKANMIGKVASATLSGGIVLCFFHPYVAPWDWAIVLTAVAQSYFSAIFYLVDILKKLKQLKLDEKAEEENSAVQNDVNLNNEDAIKVENLNIENKVESLEIPANRVEIEDLTKVDDSASEATTTDSKILTAKAGSKKTSAKSAVVKQPEIKKDAKTNVKSASLKSSTSEKTKLAQKNNQ